MRGLATGNKDASNKAYQIRATKYLHQLAPATHNPAT